MIVEASVSGFFRTILIILGAIVLLRFIGQLMIAKRNLEEERRMKEEQAKFDKELKKTKENFGRTSVLKEKIPSSKLTSTSSAIEDVDFEEVG